MKNQQWWVEKWLDLLDSYRFKKRLERARNYAREGNVIKIEFKQSQVLADVQGSDPKPYRVTLSLDPFSDEDWGYVIATMSEKAIFSAQLLSGEMPENIEQVFIANGLSLFPFSLADIRSRCTCPDQANPCKHIGAVYYQLADRFSEDPFVLFQLRGRSKEQILQALRLCRSYKLAGKEIKPEVLSQVKSPRRTSRHQIKKSTPLSVENFWQYDRALDPSLVVIAPPLEHKNALDVLGEIALPYDDAQGLVHYLRQVYHSVPQKIISLTLNT